MTQIRTESIELTAADGHRLDAYRATPAGTPRGAVVVVQEIFGVNRHIEVLTRTYATPASSRSRRRCSTACSAAPTFRTRTCPPAGC